jgi:uncharacterized membrane protein HdeD (DUF308 family)
MLTLLSAALIILGVFTICTPLLTGEVSLLTIGTFMTGAGVIEFFRALKEKEIISRIGWLVLGIITVLSGLLVIAHPLLNLGFLTFHLAVYFFLVGSAKIFIGFRYKQASGLFIASGLVSLLLAFSILSNWPLTGELAAGMLVGVELVSTGVLMFSLKRAIYAAKSA